MLRERLRAQPSVYHPTPRRTRTLPTETLSLLARLSTRSRPYSLRQLADISDFPLPAMHSAHSSFITNGDTQVNGITERDGLGSDESLGGALLTPIPWLKHNTLASAAQAASQGSEGELRSESLETDGPHGAGSIETVTVTVNGVPSATSIAHTSPLPHPPRRRCRISRMLVVPHPAQKLNCASKAASRKVSCCGRNRKLALFPRIHLMRAARLWLVEPWRSVANRL